MLQVGGQALPPVAAPPRAAAPAQQLVQAVDGGLVAALALQKAHARSGHGTVHPAWGEEGVREGKGRWLGRWGGSKAADVSLLRPSGKITLSTKQAGGRTNLR